MLKKLFNETLWYGIPTIVGRLLNYLLVFLHVRWFSSGEYGVVSNIYAAITFFNVICTFGMETSFFRWVNEQPKKTFNNTFLITLIATIILLSIFLLFPTLQSIIIFGRDVNAVFIDKIRPCIYYLLGILLFDTLAVIPFCQLRAQGRARQYAFLKALNVFIIISCQLLFLATPFGKLIPVNTKIEYIFLANFIASFSIFIFLSPVWKMWRPSFDIPLLKEMLVFSSFIFIANMGGMMNETLDRILLPRYHTGAFADGMRANGIYAAAYKLSIMVTLFVQAFRLAAEPFFFRQLKHSVHPEKIYAAVTKWFVIAISIIFLVLMLYLDIWQYLIVNKKHPEYIQGIKVVGILALANIFLGIYYNISIWYKVKKQTYVGAIIAVSAALITIFGNIIFIPKYSYMACAWTTFLAYLFMVVAGYIWGQKKYPIPYPLKSIIFYFLFALLIYGVHFIFSTKYFAINFIISTILLVVYVGVIYMIEGRSLMNMFRQK